MRLKLHKRYLLFLGNHGEVGKFALCPNALDGALATAWHLSFLRNLESEVVAWERSQSLTIRF